MPGEQPLGHRPQVQRRLQVAILEQPAGSETRPVCHDASTGHRASQDERDSGGPMIGAPGAVHPYGPAELRHGQHRGLSPRRAKPRLQCCQPRVEFAQHGSQALVLSAGWDAHRDDPLSKLAVSTDAFARIGELYGRLGLPTLIVQEGGYSLAAM